MTRYILRRRFKQVDKYLSERYKWTVIPHAFTEVELMVVLPEAMNYRDCPEMVGELHDGTLENAIWQWLDK